MQSNPHPIIHGSVPFGLLFLYCAGLIEEV
jgi:hypothetical protein